MSDTVLHGDALATLKTLPDNSVDSIVTDPPAGIHFMNKEFDHDKGGRDQWVAWLRDIMIEAKRCLRPGGHALIWALPRTSHWTATALEDAGFEVRDKLYHLFGSGFPKSHNISVAIDKLQGAEREVIGTKSNNVPHYRNSQKGANGRTNDGRDADNWDEYASRETMDITKPATPEAQRWQGWGSATKPAVEEWILCRKPLSENSIAANVLKWHTGAINIDATRVGAISEHVEWCECEEGDDDL